MNPGVAAILLVASIAANPVHDAQVAALRAVVGEHVSYVCVAVNTGTLSPPVTRGDHLESTKPRQDAPLSTLHGLTTPSTAFVPASDCTRTPREWDIIHRATGKPALLVVVGQVEVVTANHVRVAVLTTSGFLSDTHTLFDVEKSNGVWKVTSSKIILQA